MSTQTFTDAQLRKGGKKFAAFYKENPNATVEQMAAFMGESAAKVEARIESRKAFIAERKAAHEASRNRMVELGEVEEDREKAIKVRVALELQGYFTYRGDVDHEIKTRHWPCWFPKSHLTFTDGKWFAPGWLYDLKANEAAAKLEELQPNGAMRHVSPA